MNPTDRRILVIVGTRPEAVKLAPVIKLLKKHDRAVSTKVCVTGQHKEMLDPVLSLFGLTPDWDLKLMRPGQHLADITNGVLIGLREVLREWPADLVVVQGDTTTAFAAALTAFYEKVSIAHVEAGLRTDDRYNPWPEEINRKLISTLATHHFAPTPAARNNLLREGVSDADVLVTGNTVIDALLQTVSATRTNGELRTQLTQKFSFLDAGRRLIVVTAHRREHFGEVFESICVALRWLAGRQDVQIVYPVHLNPNVQEPVHRILGNVPNVHLIQPLDYLPFVALLDRAYLIITDSGGIQEEAPSLGKPVLVIRTTTERPEAIAAGTVRLVGIDPDRIIEEATRLLDSANEYQQMQHAHNPYGDGRAAERIVNALVFDTRESWASVGKLA